MSKKIYLNLLKKIQKNKYKNLLFSITQEKIYLKFRKVFYNHIKIFLNKKPKKIKTHKDKLKIFLNITYKKKKISKDERLILHSLRKKYEVNLNLKNDYDKNLIKKTNINADVNTLILLVCCICKFNLLNKIALFNLVLKIVDSINLKLYENKLNIDSPNYILKVINYEKKLYKFFNNSI